MADATREDQSLEHLEREAERTRADLAETVDQLRNRVSHTTEDLRHRVSSDSIKDGVRQYASEYSQEVLHNLQRRALENPLRAIALGTGLGYLTWRIVRSIPAPLLLIGTGFAMTRPNGQAGRRRYSATAEFGDETRRPFGATARGTTGTAGQSSMSTQGAGSAESSTMQRMTSGLGETVTGSAQATSRMASDAASAALGAASQARDQAAQTARRARDSVLDVVDRYPLLVGGIGLVVGAAIAGSVRATRMERDLVGETSDKVKDSMSQAASQAYDTASAMASRAYDAAAAAGQQSAVQARTGEGGPAASGPGAGETRAPSEAPAATPQGDGSTMRTASGDPGGISPEAPGFTPRPAGSGPNRL